jgi:FtsP/CotA-like multicopper oxidase with cupredoxin domain
MRYELAKLLWVGAVWMAVGGAARGNDVAIGTNPEVVATETCSRPAVGAIASEPENLYSSHGVLKITLSFRNSVDKNGRMRYCYTTPDGDQAPTLHVLPADEVVLTLVNQTRIPAAQNMLGAPQMRATMGPDCAGGRMDPGSTNLHFHGLDIPPACHQDDVLNTLVRPTESFVYRFVVPSDEPPGLYWYHPHAHGFSEEQVQGGASGALIVDGIEQAAPQVRGLRQRVLVLRDQMLVDTDRPRDPTVPAWDISVNAVPILYPEYQPAVLFARPLVRELWRVLNAAADTHFDLQVISNGFPAKLGLVALDGVPLARCRAVSHIVLPPGGRAEFSLAMPADGAQATLVTRAFNTGPLGDANPLRPIATLLSNRGVPLSPANTVRTVLKKLPQPENIHHRPSIRHRLLYFSQSQLYPNDPKSPTSFFLTEQGQTPAIFDMRAAPKIIVRNGDVEEWTIENRSGETHDFHIHQIHFQVLARNGVKLVQPEVRDTIPIDYWDGVNTHYPSVTLRMDFNGSACQGTLLVHCHILEHEDAGMMSSIRVVSSSDELQGPRGHSR